MNARLYTLRTGLRAQAVGALILQPGALRICVGDHVTNIGLPDFKLTVDTDDYMCFSLLRLSRRPLLGRRLVLVFLWSPADQAQARAPI